MGFFDNFKWESQARKGYTLHVQGNRLYDQDKPREAHEKHEAAMKAYEQAMAGGCNKVQYMMAYGVLLLRFGRFQEAKDLFLRCEKTAGITKQEKQQLRVNFAIAQWKLGELDSAIQQLKYALQDAKKGSTMGSLGYVLIEKARQTGDFDEAVAFNTEALDYDDEDPVLLDNMGQLYYAMGDKEKALGYFKKAHEFKPKQVDTLYYLAKIAWEDGDGKTALSYLDSALDGNYSALCTTTRKMAEDLKAQIKP